MNKEELEKEIAKTKEQLTKLQKALENKKYEKWKPEENERFYYVTSDNDIGTRYFDKDTGYDSACLETFNCFKTMADAEHEAEKILVRRKLEDIARKLNRGKEIDWSRCTINVKKYHLYCNHYSYTDNEITLGDTNCCQLLGVVYCLDKAFKDVAIQEIGKERLLRYLRGE